MAGEPDGPIGSYSPTTGFVFIFNLIVGAGALTIPHAFSHFGLIYATLALGILAVTSYMTATFMVECIAGANALQKRARDVEVHHGEVFSRDDGIFTGENEHGGPEAEERRTEVVPLMKAEAPSASKRTERGADDLVDARDDTLDFDLSKKMEMAQMAQLLFSPKGIIAFYICTIVYLYGDLAIYAVAVPKSMREIVCPRPSPGDLVWQCSSHLTSNELYRLFVILFGLLLGPFTFGHVQKTRGLQLATTIVRYVSFALMIVLALKGILEGHGRPVKDVVADEHASSVALFFGTCIYSFMCHHSVPGLVAPITNKSKVNSVIAYAFAAVFAVYLVLCYSATFRFQPKDIEDVYTLNFQQYPVRAVAYLLSLFPICTLSASFPLIAITLRENLKTLASNIHGHSAAPLDSSYSSYSSSSILALVKRHSYALLAIMPPLTVAFFTEDVSMLVGYTGSYAGLGIQWLVPACLVYSLRQRLRDEELLAAKEKRELHVHNPYASPFSSSAWLYLTLTLSGVSLVLITFATSL